MLGATKLALNEFRRQTIPKFKADDASGRNPTGKFLPTAAAALNIESAELLMRDTVADIMAKRDQATREDRTIWMTKVAHAVFMCRDAAQSISLCAGASGHFLSNPIQKAVRDANTASCHVVFDKDSRYGDYGANLFDQPITSMML